MLTGKELGEAIRSAIEEKGETPASMARHFKIKAPSVHGWITTGRIGKARLFQLIELCSDVVGPEHWGLPAAASGPGSTPALSTDEALLLDRFRAATDKRVRDFALTALINGYTSAPRHSLPSATAKPLLEEVFVGLLDMDLDAYFAKPESDKRKDEIEIGRKVIDILDRRKRTIDPREVGREPERNSDNGKMPGIAK